VAAMGVVFGEILVGISCRTIGVVKLMFLMCHASPCNTIGSDGVKEGLEMVSGVA